MASPSYTASSSNAMEDTDITPKHSTSQVKKVPHKTKIKRNITCTDNTESKSSHTQFYRRELYNRYEKITKDEYLNVTESGSNSSDTFHCVHSSEDLEYHSKQLVKKNFKKLDPDPKVPRWQEICPTIEISPDKWDIAKKLEMLVTDPTGLKQMDRIVFYLKDLAKTSAGGFRIDILDSVIIIINYLMEAQHRIPSLPECLVLLLKNMKNPILLNASSDVITHFNQLSRYLGFLGYLMLSMEDDASFDLVASAVIWQLAASDAKRGHSAAQVRHIMAAAGPVLYFTTVQMMAVVSAPRFAKYLEVAFILACDTVENCIGMVKANILEIICYRFNPYFPDRPLPDIDKNPADPQDMYLKLGESSANFIKTSSLLLVLLETLKSCMQLDPSFCSRLPCPDDYAQRCFVWGYRYECRARGHLHQRITVTVIAHLMLHVFRDRLSTFSYILMPDVMSLSVKTELPHRSDWIANVNFTLLANDLFFKIILIKFSVELLQVFPYNHLMAESHNWFSGLMYLVDPGLTGLIAGWSDSLYAELRQTALQAMTLTAMLMDPELLIRSGVINRLMWYIEWYSECPYNLCVLYWCVRLLQICLFPRHNAYRTVALKSLFETHGIVIIIHLCNTLLDQKIPPVEKSQLILAHLTKMLVSATECQKGVKCKVYPSLSWPTSASVLVTRMLDVVLYSLDKHLYVNAGWIVEVLNLIWENVVWKPQAVKIFVSEDGIHKLLDLITMTRYPVQCMAFAVICDILRTGAGVGYLVTWRANLRADTNVPQIVKRGATIVTLLAAAFKRDCDACGVLIDDKGMIRGHETSNPSGPDDAEHADSPIFSVDILKQLDIDDDVKAEPESYLHCLAAADIAGSRWSKAFAILQILTEDLQHKVDVADEAYHLYKDIKLTVLDEEVSELDRQTGGLPDFIPEFLPLSNCRFSPQNLLLWVSHFLTVKYSQTWQEARSQVRHLVPEDEAILEEFVTTSKNFVKDIRHRQEGIVKKYEEYDNEAENDLYKFIRLVLLNVSLDALRDVRCLARSTDPTHMAHVLLFDSVRAYHSRSASARLLQAPVIPTFGRILDEQNFKGQNVKVQSIMTGRSKSLEYLLNPDSNTTVSSVVYMT